jgi:hypothetical protein
LLQGIGPVSKCRHGTVYCNFPGTPRMQIFYKKLNIVFLAFSGRGKAIMIISVQAFFKKRKSRSCLSAIGKRKALLQKLVCKPNCLPLSMQIILSGTRYELHGPMRAAAAPLIDHLINQVSWAWKKAGKSSLISVMAAAQHIFRTQGETHSAAFAQVNSIPLSIEKGRAVQRWNSWRKSRQKS